MFKLQLLFIDVATVFLMLITLANSQNVGELEVVTIEMFTALQAEVNDLYGKVGTMNNELVALGKSLQNLAVDTGVVGSVELAELQGLIDVSNKQDGDIEQLIHSNGIWQNNFRIINNTFAKLKKAVVITIPPLSRPQAIRASNREMLTQIVVRNVTAFQLSPKPIRKATNYKAGSGKTAMGRSKFQAKSNVGHRNTTTFGNRRQTSTTPKSYQYSYNKNRSYNRNT